MRQNPSTKPRNIQLSPRRLFTSIPLLICEGRTPDAAKGKVEGPHAVDILAPRTSASVPAELTKQTHSSQHSCSKANPICVRAESVRSRATELWDHSLPLCLQLILVPTHCSATDQCLSAGYVLEKWIIESKPKRGGDEATLAGQFLLQAIRSHLHFSQLSAWLSRSQGRLGCKIVYKVSLPGEAESEATPVSLEEADDSTAEVDDRERHCFPLCKMERSNRVLTVYLETAKRTNEPPAVSCTVCANALPFSGPVPSNAVTSIAVTTTQPSPVVSASSLESAEGGKENDSVIDQSSSTPSSSFVVDGHDLSAIRLTPIVLPPKRQADDVRQPIADKSITFAQNPLFDADDSGYSGSVASSSQTSATSCMPPSALWEADIGKRLRLVNLGDPADNGGSGSTLQMDTAAKQREETPDRVKFYIDDASMPSSPSSLTRTKKKEDVARSAEEHSLYVRSRRKRQNSQKILFSDDKDFMEAVSETSSHSDSHSLLLPDDVASSRSTAVESPVFQKLNPVKSPKRRTAKCANDALLRKSSFTGEPSNQHYSRASRACRKDFPPRLFSTTGLPLTSSPAPLKRNQHSFNYDHTLSSVSGLKYAFHSQEHDSGSSDSEGGGSFHCKSAPASTGLLGNFEESALNGRLKPFGSVDGFMLDLAASGAFCPPHISLPVTTFFFNLSDDNAPSPYLGHCSLECVGRKGYHVPRKGTVQATLFNPQDTVVKMFVVKYDLSDMPNDCQTFVRQRTFFMPTTASLQDARRNRSWLRYLIHLRYQTSRSGKLYLHTDIRMLFSRKSELDAYNLDLDAADPRLYVASHVETPATEDYATSPAALNGSAAVCRTFELRSFTQMPNNPKFSPRKCGSSRCAAAVPTELPNSDSTVNRKCS